MRQVEWVVVTDSVASDAEEFVFALAELKRHVPVSARWLFGHGELEVFRFDVADPSSLVLVLAHACITLEARCIARLETALSNGFDVVLACDSGNPTPMRPVDYATLRGMERYVDTHTVEPHPFSQAAGSLPPLVQLTTAAHFEQRLSGSVASERVAKVSGAFVHDASGYFAGDRSEMLPLVPADAKRFLDVGGGHGNFLKSLKSQRMCETHLVELEPLAARNALDARAADRVWCGDFLKFESTERFDCVSFLDMLEHVAEPERYLAHASRLLSPHGVALLSIPNVGHWSVIADLLEGRWDYAPAGIHCITHLRFFTLRTLEDMLDRAGFCALEVQPVVVPCPKDWLDKWKQLPVLNVNAATLDTYAFLVVARLKPVV